MKMNDLSLRTAHDRRQMAGREVQPCILRGGMYVLVEPGSPEHEAVKRGEDIDIDSPHVLRMDRTHNDRNPFPMFRL